MLIRSFQWAKLYIFPEHLAKKNNIMSSQNSNQIIFFDEVIITIFEGAYFYDLTSIYFQQDVFVLHINYNIPFFNSTWFYKFVTFNLK